MITGLVRSNVDVNPYRSSVFEQAVAHAFDKLTQLTSVANLTPVV